MESVSKKYCRIVSPQKLISDVSNISQEQNDLLDMIFNFIPGTHDFLLNYAGYVQELPSASTSNTIFTDSVQSAIESLAPLGLTPITVDAHRRGYSIFVKTILNCSTDVLSLRVIDKNGNVWRPLTCSLSEFAKQDTIEISDTHVQHPERVKILFRTVLLSRCSTFPQFASASREWPLLVA